MLPAYAGMILNQPDVVSMKACAPRVCGDDPYYNFGPILSYKCSPRMRG